MRIRPLDFLLHWSLRMAKRLDGRDDALTRLDPAKVRSVLLVSSTALGDTVLSTAAFAPVRKRFPTARIVALINAAYLPLFRHCAELDETVPFAGGYLGLLAVLPRLRRARPDVALILHGNEPQATPLAYFTGARWIVKLPNANEFRFLLSNREPLVEWRAFRHGLDQRLGEAALVGADIAGARMVLPTVSAAQPQVDAFLAGARLAGRRMVGFQCGASGRSRMWPAPRFIELGRRLLAAQPDLGIVLTGSAGERGYLDSIAAGIGGGAAVASSLPLEALPALVGRLHLLVSGDTGTMHVAVAVGTPTVCLFAVSDPATSGPAYDLDRHVVIHRPCPDLAISTKSDDQRCIGRIGVDEVFAAAARQLEAGPR